MYSSYTFVIVVGSQRSGTTLTAQIIGALPYAIVIDEEDGLYQWTNSLLQCSQESEVLFSSILKNAQKKYRNPLSRFSVEGKLLPKVNSIVLKAPNLTYEWDRLSKVLPNAKIVYLKRDVRAIVASMKKLTSIPILNNQIEKIVGSSELLNMFPNELSMLQSTDIPEYRKMALIALIKTSLLKSFEKSGFNVRALEYEVLVNDPYNTVSHLLENIGLPFDRQCIDYQVEYQGFGPGKTDRTQEISNRSIEKWKMVLSSKEIEGIEETIESFYMSHKEAQK